VQRGASTTVQFSQASAACTKSRATFVAVSDKNKVVEHDTALQTASERRSELQGSIVDPVAFEAMFVQNFPLVYRFLARRVGNALADDLAAETFAIAYRRRASFDSSLAARPWLLGISTLLLRAHWREEKQSLALEARVARQRNATATTTDDAALATALAPQLATALAGLSGDQRDALLLHAWGELSSAEIAVTLGLPAATVRSRLFRARARVREVLGGDDAIQGPSENPQEPASEGIRR
jgi:RNA polymerase sigma factor (sigma-70 family)